MSPAAENFLKNHRDEHGNITWPVDEHARIELAQSLLGIHWIASCDALYAAARDLVLNSSPATPYVRPESQLAKKDAYYRQIFSTLSPEQRQAFLRLLHGQTYGALCALAFDIDQFPYSDVTVSLSNRDDEPDYYVKAIPGAHGIGIGESWAWWVRDFAAFPQPDGDSAAE